MVKSSAKKPAKMKSTGAKPGDIVRIVCSDEVLIGTFMPSEDDSIYVLKLDNGYNVGIDKKRVKLLEVTVAYSMSEQKSPAEPAHKTGLPMISILHTGGTIASKVDYRTGGVIARFSPEELIEMFPEIGKIANLRSRLLSNMWSEDMRFAHYRIMAKAIEDEIKSGCDGIIITHGTDSLHYTSAALAFMLKNLPVPVLIVGAQRSSDRGSSDAGPNLISAAKFIVSTDFSGVAICMHEKSDDTRCAILPPAKTRKDHSSRRDAFQPINCMPIAHIETDSGKVDFIEKDYPKKDKSRVLKIRDKMEEKVAILALHPNMFPDQFSFYKDAGYKGLILEGMGLGHGPTGNPNPETKIHEKNKAALADLIKKGCVVAMTSQTINGRVHLHVYSKGIELAEMGVVPCQDMTPETAFIKLAWLLGNYSSKEAKALMSENIIGEISSRTLFGAFPAHANYP
ncbi:MAG: Glu-tRNA(Gln) amidotransferase subunit GatD [Nanoarchaeota archaeon]